MKLQQWILIFWVSANQDGKERGVGTVSDNHAFIYSESEEHRHGVGILMKKERILAHQLSHNFREDKSPAIRYCYATDVCSYNRTFKRRSREILQTDWACVKTNKIYRYPHSHGRHECKGGKYASVPNSWQIWTGLTKWKRAKTYRFLRNAQLGDLEYAL